MNLNVGVAPALADPQRPTLPLTDQDKAAGSPKDRAETGIFGHTVDPSSSKSELRNISRCDWHMFYLKS